MFSRTCPCGEPKRRWQLWGAECRERLRLGYDPRPPGFWAEHRDPARQERTSGLIATRGASVPLTQVARQDPAELRKLLRKTEPVDPPGEYWNPADPPYDPPLWPDQSKCC